MYGVDLSAQFGNLMPFLGLGLILGFIYDLLGFFRVAFARSKIVVFIADFVFCVFVTVVSYLLFLGTTDGIIRVYLVIAEIIGVTVYFFTAGRLVSRIIKKIAKTLRSVVRWISSPFLRIVRKINVLSEKIRKNFFEKVKKLQNKLKKRLKDTA